MKKLILLSLLSATALIGGCARAKEELGLTRRTPDEFAVVKRAPLEIPPDLKQVTSLPAPRPGAQRPQETSPEQTAQAAIGSIGTTSNAPSSAESNLLQKAGAVQDNSSIRGLVDKEAVENADKNRPVVKRITNWGNKNDEGAASVVDAVEEAKRLKEKKSGETPTIDE